MYDHIYIHVERALQTCFGKGSGSADKCRCPNESLAGSPSVVDEIRFKTLSEEQLA